MRLSLPLLHNMLGNFSIQNKIANIEVKTGDSLLKLVDSNGREINKIVDKKLKHGIHKLRYNGSHLKNGMYFVLLENEGKRSGVSVIKRT